MYPLNLRIRPYCRKFKLRPLISLTEHTPNFAASFPPTVFHFARCSALYMTACASWLQRFWVDENYNVDIFWLAFNETQRAHYMRDPDEMIVCVCVCECGISTAQLVVIYDVRFKGWPRCACSFSYYYFQCVLIGTRI